MMSSTLMSDLLKISQQLKKEDEQYKKANKTDRAKMGRKKHGGSKKKVNETSTAK